MGTANKYVFSASTWKHLRIPFSIYLTPVFMLAWSLSAQPFHWKAVLAFFILHFLLYPASNGYNSYYDKDEGSIGGLERPPGIEPDLLWAAWLFDLLGLGLGCLIDWRFALMLFVYGMVSKAYSHPWIRLKKYPFAGWLTVGIFQGAFTFIMCQIALLPQGLEGWDTPERLWPAMLSSAMLLGSYPMTQIYQHEEDTKRGDRTISSRLGIKGTFVFTALAFAASTAGFVYFYATWHSWIFAAGFVMALGPVLAYFLRWAYQCWQNPAAADFRSTMRLNQLSAMCLNVFYIAFSWFMAS
jgi:1,4-dihydroxy-2-naphthoate octaprenyltransferase